MKSAKLGKLGLIYSRPVPAAPRPRRIPQGVRQAALEALTGLGDCSVLTDGEAAEDVARAVIDAWEACEEAGDPEITVARHYGGGWYWACWLGAVDCCDGSPSPFYGWACEEAARVAGGFHLIEVHNGRGMQ